MIKAHCTATVTDRGLSLRGTNIKEIGDILTLLLFLVPYYMKGVGFMSLGIYLQAKVVYNRHSEWMHKRTSVTLDGHSLGAGICRILAVLLYHNGYIGILEVIGRGGIKVLSKRSERYLCRLTMDDWVVNMKDPFPFLGWWSEPEYTRFMGDRKHIFDWSLASHMGYWD